MGRLILLLVIVLAVVFLAWMLVSLLSRFAPAKPAPTPPRPAPPADEGPSGERARDPFADLPDPGGDPTTLRVGDMLDYLGERSWVRGTVRFSEGGQEWAQHLLEMPDGKRWLSVRSDPDLQMFLWSPLPDSEVTRGDGGTVRSGGATYRLGARGSAEYRSEGTTGRRARGKMDYAHYSAGDGRRVSFERYDQGSWHPSVGTPVRRDSLIIFPGG